MAVRIRLMRMGKIRNPQYRIVVADARKRRDGRAIENLGIYHPKEEPSRIEVNSDRVRYWLSVGAQPSDPVRAILRKTGDWQKFRGLTPPSQPLKTAAPRADRQAVYEAEAKAAAGLADQPGKGEAEDANRGGGRGGSQPPAKKAAKKGAKKAAAKAGSATKATKAASATKAAEATEPAPAEQAGPASEPPAEAGDAGGRGGES